MPKTRPFQVAVPIFSFIVPVYSKPVEVFRKCLTSLFTQSIRDFEVIAVFDGPDAELEKVAVEFPKVKSFVIDHGGAPKARNFGMDKAIGRYLWFWDGDCFIKPDHAKRMLQEFESVPDVDFVYSGYEMAEGGGEFQSEPFDAYSLQSGNFISSMAPIKREKAPRWDETLEAAQDWDYWLTAVENGCKGVFVEGPGFVTDTYRTGLSSKKWNRENRDNTIYTVRHKHGIPDREIGVFSLNYRAMGIKLAKILNADVLKETGPTPTVYKMIVNLGYNFLSRFQGIDKDVVKVQYWIPGEIEGLRAPDAKYHTVMETVKVSKEVINYCGTSYESGKLAEIGIEAEVLPLPLAHEDLQKVSHSLPAKFTVLVATDKAYSDLLKDLAIDLPHINFIYNSGKVADFSCFLSFYQFAALDSAMLTAHVNGRHVISNVSAPLCGFIDPDQSWEKFKKHLYDKIHEVRNLPFNQEAQDYYLIEASPDKFKDAIYGLKKELVTV